MMCVLLTTTHSCSHRTCSATPCGSSFVACDPTFQSATKYYACPVCQFNLALALENKASDINQHPRSKATRCSHEDTMATSISDNASEDFSPALRIGSQEPAMGWGNLHRTRKRREEAEILERVDPNYLARRASTSSLSSLGSTVSTPSAFADMALGPYGHQALTPNLNSLRSALSSASSVLGGPTSESQNRRPSARNRPCARDPTLQEEDSLDFSSEDGDAASASCTRHASRPASYQASRCSECAGIRSGTALHHLEPADIPEDITRAEMKNMSTWKGWVPVAEMPTGEFQRFPEFDRRGMVVVGGTEVSVTRSPPNKRRMTTGGKLKK